MRIGVCSRAELDRLRISWPIADDVAGAHFQQQRDGGASFLVGWQDDQPVGWALVQWRGCVGDNARAAFPDCVELNHLQVRPERRGQGVGSAILAAAEQLARERGQHRLAVSVGLDNPDADRLYQRLGYRPTGVIDVCAYRWRSEDLRWHDEVESGQLLIKPIGPPVLDPMSAARSGVLHQLAEQLPEPVGSSCVRIGIDGPDGSGKTALADQLAEVARELGRPVIRASVDDFHQVRSIRYQRGRDSPEGFWLDSFDYLRLHAALLDPLGPGGSRRYRPAIHHLATDALLDLPELAAAAGSIVIVDGLFLHRDELAGCWEQSIYLDVPFAVTTARMAGRDGSHPDPDHPSLRRYQRAQLLYAAACSPTERASIVIDNADLDRPALRK